MKFPNDWSHTCGKRTTVNILGKILGNMKSVSRNKGRLVQNLL